jgi:hypothetical protein
MPREQLVAVDELATARGQSVSEIVREAIEAYFRVPHVVVTMAFHGTSSAILRLAGPNIEFAGVAPRTQTFEQRYQTGDSSQLPLLTG